MSLVASRRKMAEITAIIILKRQFKKKIMKRVLKILREAVT